MRARDGSSRSPARRHIGPFALSLVVHGGLVLGALLWFTATQAAPRPPRVLQAAMEFVEPDCSDTDVCEDVVPAEELPAELEVTLPEEFLPTDTPPEECDLPDTHLPDCDFEHVAEPTLDVPDIPLHAARSSRPKPPPAPVAVPRPVPTIRRPVARRPQPQRAAGGRPLRLVHRPNLMHYYPAEARRRGIEGEALVEIRVDERGTVVDAKIVRSSGSALLDRQALRVMYDYRFAPGDGGRSQVPVNFRLR